jgi:two-component system, NtrC family, sensor kinase
MKLSLRTRLLLSFLAVIVVISAFSTVVGLTFIRKSTPQVQDAVKTHLKSARRIYEDRQTRVGDVVRLTAVRFFMRDYLAKGNTKELVNELASIQRSEALDILNLTDPTGRNIIRGHRPEHKEGTAITRELANRVLVEKKVLSITIILTPEEMAIEGDDLAAKAKIPTVRTPHAEKTPDMPDGSGMVMLAAAPILDDAGRPLGVLFGGRLLSRDFDLVDLMKDTIFESEKYEGKDIGAVAIFMGSKRVATNTTYQTGERALGTLVAEEVYQRTMVDGKPWIDRAFAVDEWYITAYEPIYGVEGIPVGILGVGLIERRYKEMETNALWTFVLITVIGILSATGLCFLLTRTIMGPVKSLIHATEKLGQGNFEERADIEDAPEEIAKLGRAFDSMAASIRERDAQLRDRAQKEVMRSERLAMIGQLASGVAHEINNPLGSIFLFGGLLLKRCPPGSPMRENLERIEKEAKRCQSIVQGLLEFSRQREPKIESTDPNELIETTMRIFDNQPIFHNIRVIKEFQPDLPEIMMDPAQIQQVLINIVMNAVDAMKGKGVLTIRTRCSTASGAMEISFTDTGCGIPDDIVDRIFEPFFTTKGVGHGTGLGLSISLGIMQVHGGSIRVASRVGEGSTFTLVLPIARGSGNA